MKKKKISSLSRCNRPAAGAMRVLRASFNDKGRGTSASELCTGFKAPANNHVLRDLFVAVDIAM